MAGLQEILSNVFATAVASIIIFSKAVVDATLSGVDEVTAIADTAGSVDALISAFAVIVLDRCLCLLLE